MVDLTEYGLPPRPDPETGEPFPPHAPGFTGRKTIDEGDQEPRRSRRPKPPPGQGAVLAWYQEGWRGRLKGYGIALAIVVPIFILYFTVADASFESLAHWFPWVGMLVTAFLMSAPFTVQFEAAGAEWVSKGHKRWWRRRPYHGWVRLYELEAVHGDWSMTGSSLVLSDGEHTMGMPVRRFQHNRRIWDLTYNGILHSIASGAELNEEAATILRIGNDHPLLGLAAHARRQMFRTARANPDQLTLSQLRRIKYHPAGVALRQRNGVPDDVSLEGFRQLISSELERDPDLFTQTPGRRARPDDYDLPPPGNRSDHLDGLPPTPAQQLEAEHQIVDATTDEEAREHLAQDDTRKLLAYYDKSPDDMTPDDFRHFMKHELIPEQLNLHDTDNT